MKRVCSPNCSGHLCAAYYHCGRVSSPAQNTGRHRVQRRDSEPALSHAPPAPCSGRGERQPPTQPRLSTAVADCLHSQETQLFPGARKKSPHLSVAPDNRGEAEEKSGSGGAAPRGDSARRAARAPAQCSRRSPVLFGFPEGSAPTAADALLLVGYPAAS